MGELLKGIPDESFVCISNSEDKVLCFGPDQDDVLKRGRAIDRRALLLNVKAWRSPIY